MSGAADFSAAWLGDYLTHRLGEPVVGEALDAFTRGTSRQTWFGRYRTADGTTDIVLRTDHPAGSGDPTPLDQEYFIYDRLGGAELPVARALWWEEDPVIAPRAFYMREMIAGSWNIPGYSDPDPAFDDVRVTAAKEHLEALVKVHALDWRALGFGDRLPAPASEADAAHLYLDSARARVDEVAGEAVPIFLEASEWLHDNAPVASRISLCKGTNGLGEEVFRDGRLVALSDWEEVAIGDPASDLAIMQGFGDPIVRDGAQIWGIEQAIDHYRAAGGAAVTLESVRYYQAVRALKLVVLARHAAIVGHKGAGAATIRQIWTGTEVLHLCKHTLAAAMGMLPSPDAGWFIELNQSVDML